MRLYALGTLLALSVVALMTATPATAYIVNRGDVAHPQPTHVDDIIDDFETVAIAIIKWLADQIPIKEVTNLIDAIVDAWVVHERKVHYWEHVEQEVKDTCGEYINKVNVDRVMAYKDDVAKMLDLYKRCPTKGNGTYPDKNTEGDAITTSIISNRFLVEAAEQPWSLMLYFVDLASVHLTILKDLAETYSTDTEQSQWWQDVSDATTHYDDYSQKVYNQTIAFKKQNINCVLDKGPYHYTYTMLDEVTGKTDTCTEVAPASGEAGSCATACEDFKQDVLQTFDTWFGKFVAKPRDSWRLLKAKANHKMAA